jgi:ubiquinone/menaquinone biosynthesis C-methylase UbiE
MVGSEGAVLGVERAASSIAAARHRAADLGLRNVSFVESDLAAFETDRQFDAIVGRFVLSYVPDRAEVLRKLARNLGPGGIVAFLELDIGQIAQVPPSDLFLQVRRWLLEAFAAGGTELEMGSKLYETFLRAGLPIPQMTAVHPVAGGAAQEYHELVLGLRSLLPTIERQGIASASEIALDTLAERLSADATTHDRVVFLSRIVGAWTRLD